MPSCLAQEQTRRERHGTGTEVPQNMGCSTGQPAHRRAERQVCRIRRRAAARCGWCCGLGCRRRAEVPPENWRVGRPVPHTKEFNATAHRVFNVPCLLGPVWSSTRSRSSLDVDWPSCLVRLQTVTMMGILNPSDSLAPIVCNQCKRRKKKCDKALPTCGRCCK